MGQDRGGCRGPGPGSGYGLGLGYGYGYGYPFSMTNPPALGAASERTATDLPTLAYAGAYPVALISRIVVARVPVEVLRG
ncbi:MAG: hypothetical protein FJ087_05395 [Deltaproteobacteria bacterium]|nr:hypothetical protein [Deltaproteobacteria bacterium]